MNEIDQITKWFDTQQTASFLIRKEEDGDVDEVNLRLQNISLGSMRHSDPDGYVSDQAILLHGEGCIAGENTSADLPQQVYEIPLEEHTRFDQRENELLISTGRADYSIKPLS